MKISEIVMLTEEDVVPPYKLYCDMDGCLTDFDKRFFDLTGMKPDDYENKYGENQFWNFIDVETGIKFWSEMEWTNRGHDLWEFISQFQPELLTSPSKHNHSRVGKAIWVKNNLKPLPKINFKYSKEKHDFATPTSILIDDRKSIIERWNKAGGIGIHHPKNTMNIEPIKEKLNKLYNEFEEED